MNDHGLLATIELPFGGGDGVCAAPSGGTLHAFVVDGARSAHWSIDAGGRATSHGDVALAVADVAATDDGLRLVGDTDGGHLVVAALDAAGREAWRHSLAATGPLLHAPLVLARGAHATVAWEEERGDASDLAICDVDASGVAPVHRLPLAGATLRLAARSIDGGIVVARLAGIPPRATLLRIDGARIAVRRDIVEAGSGPVAFAREGGDVALAWCDGARLVVARFDAMLAPLEPARGIPAGDVDRLTGFDGERAVFAGTRWPSKPALRGVAPKDGATAQLFLPGRVLALPAPVGRIEAGGWIGDRFVLVHGDDVLASSVFAG